MGAITDEQLDDLEQRAESVLSPELLERGLTLTVEATGTCR